MKFLTPETLVELLASATVAPRKRINFNLIRSRVTRPIGFLMPELGGLMCGRTVIGPASGNFWPAPGSVDTRLS
jgi:hypothetical protein